MMQPCLGEPIVNLNFEVVTVSRAQMEEGLSHDEAQSNNKSKGSGLYALSSKSPLGDIGPCKRYLGHLE